MNWAPVIVQVIAFASVVLAASTFVSNRSDRNRSKTSEEIERSVTSVSLQLKGELQSISSKVSSVERHLETQDRRLIRHGEDIASIKGKLSAS
jgi:negative regulator of sigma E activity